MRSRRRGLTAPAKLLVGRPRTRYAPRVRAIGVVLAIGVTALAAGNAALAAPANIPSNTRTALLEQARTVAAAEGDRHPYDIWAVSTTRMTALRHLDPGATEPSCEATPSCTNEPMYVLAMRGRFSCNTCSPPAGARIPPGTVITLGFQAEEPLPHYYSAFSFTSHYPDLKALGVPTRLGPPRHSTKSR